MIFEDPRVVAGGLESQIGGCGAFLGHVDGNFGILVPTWRALEANLSILVATWRLVGTNLGASWAP